MAAPDFCVSSLGTLLHVSAILAHRILQWLLDFWKIWSPCLKGHWRHDFREYKCFKPESLQKDSTIIMTITAKRRPVFLTCSEKYILVFKGLKTTVLNRTQSVGPKRDKHFELSNRSCKGPQRPQPPSRN